MFASFHRAATHTAYTGAGLGLAICQRVITRHGGAIGVTDNPGGGTCIHFSLPITSPAAIEPTLATPATWTTPPADATSSGARGHGAEMRPPFLFGRLHYGLVAAPRTTKLATRPANTHDVPGRLGASRSAGRPAPQSGYR